jgi:hypothetical protein
MFGHSSHSWVSGSLWGSLGLSGALWVPFARSVSLLCIFVSLLSLLCYMLFVLANCLSICLPNPTKHTAVLVFWILFESPPRPRTAGFLLQTQFRIQNSACDNCLICTSNVLNLCICVANMCGVGIDEDVKSAVRLFTCLVIGCFVTQAGCEIKKRGITEQPPVPGAMQKHVPPQMQNRQ